MNKYTLKLAIAASAMALYFTGCGDDVLVSEDVNQTFSTVSAVNPDDCNDKTEGSMAFVKSTATMYVCTDGEWIALNEQDAIQYRCDSKQLKDKSGFAIVCDGDTLGIIKNGKDGIDGKDGAKGDKGDTGATGATGAKGDKGDKGDTGATGAKGDKGDKGDTGATGASGSNGSKGDTGATGANGKSAYEIAKEGGYTGTEQQWLESLKGKDADMDKITNDINNMFSSASSQLDDKFNQAYSSLNDELESKACHMEGEPVKDLDAGTITVKVVCGTAEKDIVIPINVVDGNTYSKHVVVRFPVQAEKGFGSEQIYEQLWADFKGGDHTELTVMDLDKKLNATGKMFVTDLFADGTNKKDFVTIEETNEKITEYKVARLEGDLDLTNLSNPLVQLRIKMSLSNSNNRFMAFGGNGSTSTTVIYNAIVDLSDESDTVVIDFLTDYKAERVKTLVKSDKSFAEASEQANGELAKALALVKDEKVSTLPAFEHYLPGSDKVGLNEYFNSIVWVMALIDQNGKIPSFNKIYNDYRKVFAKNGDFNTAVVTTYNGTKRSLFFVDYLALLINANFYRWNCQHSDDYSWGANCETESYTGEELDIYYKILQKGFVSAYKLDTAEAVEVDKYSKVQKSGAEGGYFRYFKYYRSEKVWYPLNGWAEGAAVAETGKCAASTKGTLAVFTLDFWNDEDTKTYSVDYSMECLCEGNKCEYGKVDPCQGREEGHEGYTYLGTDPDPSEYICQKMCSEPTPTSASSSASNSEECVIEAAYNYSSPSSSAASSSPSNGKTIEELINEGRLGTCDATVANDPDKYLVQFDYDDAMISTRTRHDYYMCQCSGDECKWIEADWTVLEFGMCSETVMKTQTEFKESSGNKYKCDYLDYEKVYGWTLAQLVEMDVKVICHYGISERTHNNEDGAPVVDAKGTFSADSLYVCAENSELSRNHTHDWRESTVDEYCAGHAEPTTQMVTDEQLPENIVYNEKCSFKNVLYVRNNTADGVTEWINPQQYLVLTYGSAPSPVNGNRRVATRVALMRSIADGFYLFLNGYTDVAVYQCTNNNCVASTMDAAVQALSGKKDAVNLLNIQGNYSYTKIAEGTYDASIKFTAQAYTLESPDAKVTIIASASRTDWHAVGVADKLGACNETVMANTSSNWKEFNSQKYKCDCMETAGTASTAPECEWTPGSEKEVALNKPCTGNLVSGETPTLQNDAQGVPQVCSTVYDESQKPKHDWTVATPEQAFGVCDADKMAAQTKLSKLGSDYYKCDCEGEPSRSTAIMYSGCAWIQATELEVTLDAAKNAPCTAKLVHEEDGWTFSKNNLYYCGRKGIENTNDHEHNWLNMTSYLWCSVKSKSLAGHENCTGGYEACSICNDIPEGVEESGTTFIYRANSGATETVTAETYFGVDCSQEPKFIGNLESYEKGWYEFSDGVYMYKADNSLVHDFICKNGHVAEAADANEACNAAFAKTEICTYMNEQYEHNGSGWVKMNCSTLHDENGRETKGRLCTMADGSEHYREWDHEDSYQVGIGSSTSTMYYKDKWYDVSDYCATKGDHCYKEGQEPTDMTSSIDCEFVRPYMEKEVFYCDQTDGVWKKDLVTSAEDYCNRKLKMEYGIVSCSVSNVQAYCSSAAGQNDPNNCGTSFTFFNFQCELPEGLLYEGQQNMRCDYDWDCNGSDDDGCIRWGFSA